MSREALLSPYRDDHHASAERRKQRPRPKTLHQYLLWMEARLAEEYPDGLHSPRLDPDSIHAQTIGDGGFKALNADFLQYVDGNPYARDIDGSYRFPLRAALTTISRGRGSHESGAPFMGRFLYAISRGASWDVASARFAIPPAVAPIYALEAMRRLYDAYSGFES